MPVLWQSSQRPMYVRTIWAGGFRHAVLTHDDPYLLKLYAKRRPNSSASRTKSRLSYRTNDDLQDCLRKLNLVLTSDKSQINYRERPKTSHVERLNLYGVDLDPEQGLITKASPDNLDTPRSSDSFNSTMRNFRPNKTSRVEVKDNTELSERVFQWLDLAGKIDLLAPKERMSQPRHSWPELQRQLTKSKTAIDIRKDERNTKVEVSKAQQNTTLIDRSEFYVPTSANTIENYVRQSRNKNTPRHETTKKDKKARDLKTNVIETRQKVISEKNAVQKQYAEMLSKKLIPDVSKGSKRQVHIFMPDLPKKIESFQTSRTESLLSQLSNKVVKQATN